MTLHDHIKDVGDAVLFKQQKQKRNVHFNSKSQFIRDKELKHPCTGSRSYL